MKTTTFELPVREIPKAAETPAVTALHAQRDGSLLCGLSFCHPLLFRVKPAADGTRLEATEDLKLEEQLGGDPLAITHGLRSTTSGDTAFAVLHAGMLPNFLRNMFGGNLLDKSGEALTEFLQSESGGFVGGVVRHSVVQMSDRQLRVRRFREPGVLLDVAHIGDFIFGLTGSGVWREPYLNSEKRESLRKDLVGNYRLHRDDSGMFWLLGETQRLLRLEQTDLKAKPTPLKLASLHFPISAASATDGWLYGVSGERGNVLFRVRRNPESLEEESQKVTELSQRITGLVAVDAEAAPAPMGEATEAAAQESGQARAPRAEGKLLIATEGAGGAEAEIWAAPLVDAEDREIVPPAPKVERVGTVDGIRCVSNLTVSADRRQVWGGEGRLGSGEQKFRKPRLVRLTDF